MRTIIMEFLNKIRFMIKIDLKDITYLYGKQAEFVLEGKPEPSFLQMIYVLPKTIHGVLNYVFTHSNLKENEFNDLKCDYLFFAGTYNQFHCLENVFLNIPSEKKLLIREIIEVAEKESLKIQFNKTDIFWGTFFLLTKGFVFWMRNVNKNRKGLFYARSIFLLSLFHCAYFYRSLKQLNPKIVVMSNDHNAPNRSLLYASKYLNNKTAYLQHASVTNILPPLEFDYAFLDGLAAHEAYKVAGIRKDDKNTKIFLSGCQKQINHDSARKRNEKEADDKVVVGLAINTLDDIDEVFLFCEELSKFSNINVILRNHPAQDVIPIKNRFQSLSNVKIEDFDSYSAQDFLNKIDMMIAGNTSMHLEASLSGIPCYYIEFGKCSPARKDYYGYLKSRLIDPFPEMKYKKEKDFLNLIEFDAVGKKQALKKYSNTYSSSWEGKEGELVAQTITDICYNKPVNLFKLIECDDFYNYLLYDIIN